MRISAYLVCFFLFFSSLILAQNLTMKDTVTYSMGLVLANDLNALGIDEVNTEVLLKAINDFKEGNPDFSITEAQNMVNEYKVKAAQEVGQKFLEENAKKEGVVTLPSGLQYTIMTSGEGGPKPTPTSKVKAHYHGTLIDGNVFDSSVNRGQPLDFPVNGVIKGWQEALQLMSVGDKWKLFIPYDLAYGARGAGGVIPPYATLIFEVELISFE